MTSNKELSSESSVHAFSGILDWGLGEVAYVRKEHVDSIPMHVVYAANGERLAAAETESLAHAMIMQNDMARVRLH